MVTNYGKRHTTDENVPYLVEAVCRELGRYAPAAGMARTRLERERKDVLKKIERLVRELEDEDGEGMESVKTRLKELEARRAEVDRELATAKQISTNPAIVEGLAERVRAQIGKTRELFRRALEASCREAQALREELHKYVKAVRIYRDGLVRVTATLEVVLSAAPLSVERVGSGGSF